MDELAELDLVGEDEVGVVAGDGDEGGVEGVGDLDEEAGGAEGVAVGGGGEDLEDLEEGGAVVAGNLEVGAGVAEELGQNARG